MKQGLKSFIFTNAGLFSLGLQRDQPRMASLWCLQPVSWSVAAGIGVLRAKGVRGFLYLTSSPSPLSFVHSVLLTLALCYSLDTLGIFSPLIVVFSAWNVLPCIPMAVFHSLFMSLHKSCQWKLPLTFHVHVPSSFFF